MCIARKTLRSFIIASASIAKQIGVRSRYYNRIQNLIDFTHCEKYFKTSYLSPSYLRRVQIPSNVLRDINRVIFSQSTQCASNKRHRSACSPLSLCCFFKTSRSISCESKEEIIAKKVAIDSCMAGNELL